MTLDDYLREPGSLTVAQLRERIGAKSDMQIRQWQHGYAGRYPGPIYCLAIERATGGAVTRRDLRPDDAHLIWPDLAESEPNTPPAPADQAQAAINNEVTEEGANA